MKSRSFVHRCCFAMLLMGSTPAFTSTQGGLLVDGRTGQAAMFQVSGKCLALTAGHVMGDADAGTFTVAPGRDYRVRLLKNPETVDLAMVAVETADNSACPEPFFPMKSEKSIIDQSVQAQVKLEGNGLIGGSIVGYDNDFTTFTMRPYDVGDPRLERGISGALVTINNEALGIVTKIEGTGSTRVLRVVGMSAVRKNFSEFLPSVRVYKSYDLSWWPANMAAAVKKANDSVQTATDIAEQAQQKDQEARAIVSRAIAVPGRVDQVNRNSVYYFLADKTANKIRSEIKTTTTQFPNFSYTAHGLGEYIDDQQRRVLIGKFADGELRLGGLYNEVTATRPKGTNRIFAAWNEKNALVSGRWELADGRTLFGEFTGSIMTSGLIKFVDGSHLIGTWDAKSGNLEGYCSWWKPDGSYDKGGTCKNGNLVQPIIQP